MPNISKKEYARLIALSKGIRAKRNRPKRGPKAKKKANKQAAGGPRAPKAVVDYGLASLQPWSGEPAGLPVAPALRSQKIKAWCKGVVEVGTAGFGFVIVRPVYANDTPVCFHSLAEYAGTVTSGTAGGGVFSDVLNSPYASADYGVLPSEKRGRVVALGVRVRYTGTNLNRGGRVLTLEHPTHRTLDGLSFTALQNYQQAKVRTTTTHDWTGVTWQHVVDAEREYSTAGWAPDVSPQLAVAIQGLAGNTYEYEVYCQFEVSGQTVATVSTDSAVHTLEHGNVLAASSQLSPESAHKMENAHPTKVRRIVAKTAVSKDPLRTMEREASNIGTALGPAATDAARLAPLMALM